MVDFDDLKKIEEIQKKLVSFGDDNIAVRFGVHEKGFVRIIAVKPCDIQDDPHGAIMMERPIDILVPLEDFFAKIDKLREAQNG